MKYNFKGISLVDLCSWFGLTRQAYYQNKHRVLKTAIEEEILILEIRGIRKKHKCLGGRKLFGKLEEFMYEHQIKMGRDAFFDLLRSGGLLVRRRKRHHVTTNSNHWMKKYPNLIKDLEPVSPNHIWVSDITYWKTKGGHYYISFITDAYSRKIVGYQVAETMEAIESIYALKMALKGLDTRAFVLIHHSDRGSQYCSAGYVELLRKNNIQISMTENGDPLENALAERLNGIIKGEYLFDYQIDSLEEAKTILESVVGLYNEERPHSSVGNMVPSQVHEGSLDKEVRRLWKNYYKKRELSEMEK
ncbi:IS3 family transposase [Cyclobacterium salsum]|uniref:IS3 family transposase n=1 Tax=Cyclobacterium salsum TaxID=2666329 RepID=UPI001F2295CA|nr:IS3 family transposase [Cyclobacterium salsum]